MQHLHAELYRTDTMTIHGLHVTFVLVIFRYILLHVDVGCSDFPDLSVQQPNSEFVCLLCDNLAFQRVDVVCFLYILNLKRLLKVAKIF